MKRAISLLMAVLMAVSVLFTVNLSAVAYGDSILDATTVTTGKTYTGTLSESNTTDNFAITLTSSGLLSFQAKAAAEYMGFRIYNADGHELWGSTPYWNSTSGIISISTSMYLTSGKYYVNMYRRNGCNGSYEFSLGFASSGETFKESGWGNNNDIMNPNAVSFGKTYKGMIAKNDDTDFYKFSIATTGLLNVKVNASMEYIKCSVYNESGNVVWETTPYWNSTSRQIVIDAYPYLTSGTYYMSLSKRNGSTGNYSFSLGFTSSGESFKETGYGSNNSMAAANSIETNKLYKGVICNNDNQDMYVFKFAKDTTIPFKFQASMQYIYVKFFNSLGTEIKGYSCYWNSTSRKITIDESLTFAAGTYYMSVSKRESNIGNYNFSLGAVLTAPTISSLKATPASTSVKLTWKESANATGAKVYLYDASAKSYKALKTITSTSYTVTGLKAGKSYKFAVKPYASANGKTVWGKTYTVTAITLPGTPAPKATQTTSSVKLTWKAVSGATGYRVYQKVNGSWSAKKTLTGTSYTISGLKSGTTYQFAVRAYAKIGSKTVWGSYKTFTTATKPATPAIKLASTAKGRATITWTNVAGETGYQIYYSTSKSSGYKKLTNIAANTTKVYAKNLKSGRTYYFRVRAYKSAGGKYIYGAFSNVGALKIK